MAVKITNIRYNIHLYASLAAIKEDFNHLMENSVAPSIGLIKIRKKIEGTTASNQLQKCSHSHIMFTNPIFRETASD